MGFGPLIGKSKNQEDCVSAMIHKPCLTAKNKLFFIRKSDFDV